MAQPKSAYIDRQTIKDLEDLAWQAARDPRGGGAEGGRGGTKRPNIRELNRQLPASIP